MHGRRWLNTSRVRWRPWRLWALLQELLFLRPNRRAVVAVMGDLRPRLTRAEVEAILGQSEARRLERHAQADTIRLTGPIALAEHWQLTISFDGDRLARARARDGSGERVNSAPADLADAR